MLTIRVLLILQLSQGMKTIDTDIPTITLLEKK